MTLHRTLIASLLCGALLSGCNQAGPDVGSNPKRQSFQVGSSQFSIPIGSDGYVQSTAKGANWGFDPQTWARTVGAISATNGNRPSPYAVVGNSSMSDAMVKRVLNKDNLNKIASNDGEAYRSSDPIYKYPPVYFFQKDLPGYVECPTATTQGREPDMERCMIHIVKDDVHHSFSLTARQVPMAAEAARVFLAVITPE